MCHSCVRVGGSTRLQRGKDYLFAVNGQTGKLVGDLPMNWGKFWAAFAAPLSIIGTLITLL